MVKEETSQLQKLEEAKAKIEKMISEAKKVDPKKAAEDKKKADEKKKKEAEAKKVADKKAADAFGLSGYPYFVLVDAQGKVFKRLSGEIPMDELTAIINQMIGA